MSSVTPTTNSSLPFCRAEFETISEGLDYAARGETGCNFFTSRGELARALPYGEVRLGKKLFVKSVYFAAQYKDIRMLCLRYSLSFVMPA